MHIETRETKGNGVSDWSFGIVLIELLSFALSVHHGRDRQIKKIVNRAGQTCAPAVPDCLRQHACANCACMAISKYVLSQAWLILQGGFKGTNFLLNFQNKNFVSLL